MAPQQSARLGVVAEADREAKKGGGDATDVGSYTYHATKKHAVASIAGTINTSYTYEPPNAISGRGRTTCVLRKFPDKGWLVVHVHEGALPQGIPPIGEPQK